MYFFSFYYDCIWSERKVRDQSIAESTGGPPAKTTHTQSASILANFFKTILLSLSFFDR